MEENKLLQLQVSKSVRVISRKLTLIQIYELLEKCNIRIKGGLRESKTKILRRSLKAAKSEQLRKLLLESGGIAKKKVTTPDVSPGLTLHPTFTSSKVSRYFHQGDPEEAVRVAFVKINNTVKRVAGLDNKDGVKLMQKTFSADKPLIRFNDLTTQEDKDEQTGLMNILVGCILAFRNPPSHDDERKMSTRDAKRILNFASYLMERIEGGYKA